MRILLLAFALALTGCGGGSEDPGSSPKAPGFKVEDPGPVHVHGLGVNPADGALFVATHTGLFRAGKDEEKATRVADRYQDTMGFKVAGPDHFLGSGHPDGRERKPPFLGLIRSADAGKSWTPVSLSGERDFHILESAGRQVYGYGTDFKSREEGLLVSPDGGKTWAKRAHPEPLRALAIDPKDEARVVATGETRLWRSDDAGRKWRQLVGPLGLVTWDSRSLMVVDDRGAVSTATGVGTGWEKVGEVGGPPAALAASGGDYLVALHDGTIKRSEDGGEWTVRSRP